MNCAASMRSLQDNERAVFTLLKVYGCTYAEIGQILGLTPEQVVTTLVAAVRHFAIALERKRR